MRPHRTIATPIGSVSVPLAHALARIAGVDIVIEEKGIEGEEIDGELPWTCLYGAGRVRVYNALCELHKQGWPLDQPRAVARA